MAKSRTGVLLCDTTKTLWETLGNTRERSPNNPANSLVEVSEAERLLATRRWLRFELGGETVPHGDVEDWAAGLREPGDGIA